jgi:hypothetical protein
MSQPMPINKPNITPGQGLLLLMQQYHADARKLQELKVLYLCGANTSEKCITLCDYLINEPFLDAFELTIN